MIVKESGATFEIRRSDLVKEDRYVDNACQKMWARPTNLVTLEVKTMNFSGPRGKFTVEMSDITPGMKMPAMRFEMQGGIVYPLNKNGEVTFDTVNTPNIVKFARGVDKEIEERRKIRRQITEATFMFQMSLAQLGAAVGPPSVPKGPQPSSVRVPATPRTPVVPPKPPKPPTPPPRSGNTIVESPPPPPPKAPANPRAPAPPPRTTIVESPPPPPRPQPAPKVSKANKGADVGSAPTEPAPAQPPKVSKGPSSGSDMGHAPTDPAPGGPAPEQPVQEPGAPPPNPPPGKSPSNPPPSSGHTVGETPPPPGKKPMTREEVLEVFEKTRHKSLPPTQRIKIKTPKGVEEMTVGEYRVRREQALEWMKKNPGKNHGTKFYDPSESYKQAAEQFGLDPMWHRPYGLNPYL
jgi:hypothetical protein